MIHSSIELEQDDQGLDCVRLQWNGAEALIYLQGAHIAIYAPAGSENILWVSETSFFQPGKAIRGGIPICWPWFGQHSEADRPQHGYARQSVFRLLSSKPSEEYAQVVLRLDSSEAPFGEWLGKFDLEIEVRLSDHLWMEMLSHNRTAKTQVLSTCLHSYFAVADARQIQLPDLTKKSYLDKVENGENCTQEDPFSIAAEVDRIYLNAPESIWLFDPVVDRKIEINSWGCEQLVVWNPWADKAKQMQDFDDRGYLKMVCVEPANALPGSVTVNPRETHSVGQTLRLTS